MRTKTHTRLLVLLAVFSLLAAACGGSDEAEDVSSTDATDVPSGGSDTDASDADEAPVVSEAPTTTDSPTTTTGGSDEAETAEEAPEAGSSEAAGGECLVGSWVITATEMDAFLATTMSQTGGADVVFTVTGNMGMDFADDGTFTYLPAFSFAMEVGGIAGEGDATGSAAGTYTTEDGVIEAQILEDDVSIEVSVAGIAFDAGNLGDNFLTSIPIAEAPYTCGADGPEIEFKAGAGTTHTMHLTPA